MVFWSGDLLPNGNKLANGWKITAVFNRGTQISCLAANFLEEKLQNRYGLRSLRVCRTIADADKRLQEDLLFNQEGSAKPGLLVMYDEQSVNEIADLFCDYQRSHNTVLVMLSDQLFSPEIELFNKDLLVMPATLLDAEKLFLKEQGMYLVDQVLENNFGPPVKFHKEERRWITEHSAPDESDQIQEFMERLDHNTTMVH